MTRLPHHVLALDVYALARVIARLEDPARVLKAGRAKRALPSILRAGEMRQTKIEAAPTAMRSPNFWAGCSQDPAAINHWPRGNYIVLSNYSTTYQMC